MDKFFKDKYLEQNKEYYTHLIDGLKHLEILCIKLIKYKINIKDKPWYKNIIKYYVPDAKKFYSNCNKEEFNIDDYNKQWMRTGFKSFLSEIEKFIKFITRNSLHIETNTFNSEINNLKKIKDKYKMIFNDERLELQIDLIHDQLHHWRNIQNKNKHEEEHWDSNYYITDNHRTLIAGGNDILEYVSDSIYQIINPLLLILIIIFESVNNPE